MSEEYNQEHDHGHSHGHAHEHAHDHSHTHTHEHPHADDRGAASGEITPKQELVALMRYMAGHNSSHVKELADLAEKVKELCGEEAYGRITEAVERFDQGNEILTEVLGTIEE